MEVTVSISAVAILFHTFRKSLNWSEIYSWNNFGLSPYLLEAFGGLKDCFQLVFPVHFTMSRTVTPGYVSRSEWFRGQSFKNASTMALDKYTVGWPQKCIYML